MKAVLLQSDLIWHDPELNKAHFEKMIAGSDPADLIILPEMFTTGFTRDADQVAENMDGETVHWMKRIAKDYNCAITGSLVISENGQYYNRLLFVEPSGEIHCYDKRHLFTLAGEEKTYTSGKEKLIVQYKNWKICLLICYDLRFPVFSRNTEDYDVLIYVANWPKERIAAWDSLLKARAIENMCYVIGVNRIGSDHSTSYNGHSQVIDCLGNYIISPASGENILAAELDKDKLKKLRLEYGFLNDRDSFTVKQNPD